MHMRTFILLASLLMSTTTLANTPAKTTPDQIRAAARAFLNAFSEQLATTGHSAEFQLGQLDRRLQLAPCTSDLAISFSGDPWQSTQPTLLVACRGERPWRMFLPTALTITGQVFSANRPIGRGERITRDMISAGSGIMNNTRQAPITQLGDLLGKELTRSVNRGSVFTPNLVVEPDAVQRGDHVIITARSGGFTVHSRGKALANGQPGEQVLVENLSSSRRVRGRVVAPGKVEIPM